jgi:hypothetical protein
MKTLVTISLILAFIIIAPGASAQTQQLSSTNYFVLLDLGEEVQQPNGRKVVVGLRSHGNLVSDTGETTSIWCDVTNELNDAGAATVGAFVCRQVYDNGDIVWVGGVQQLPSGSATWTVLGGTGRYQGATGSGTTENISQRADGYAWTSKSKGTLTLKKGS